MHAALPCNEAGTTGTVGPHPSSGALILNAGPVGFVARPCPLRSTAGGGPCAICSASRPARTDGRGAASGSSRSGRASAPHRHRRAGLGGSSVRCCLPVFLAGGGSVRLFLAAPAPPRTVRGGQLVVEILFVWQGRSGTAFPGLPPPPPSWRLLLRRRFQGLYRFPPRPTGRASKRAGPPPRAGVDKSWDGEACHVDARGGRRRATAGGHRDDSLLVSGGRGTAA